MELDCNRELLRETLEEWDNMARLFDNLSTRLQARLDQFSAEHNIVPALDLLDGEPPEDISVEEVTNFLGPEDLGVWIRLQDDGRDNFISAANIASNLEPKTGDKHVEILALITSEAVDGPQPPIMQLAKEELAQLGFYSWIDDHVSHGTRTVKLTATVDDPLVDGFVLKLKLFGDPLEEDEWQENI